MTRTEFQEQAIIAMMGAGRTERDQNKDIRNKLGHGLYRSDLEDIVKSLGEIHDEIHKEYPEKPKWN
ncbi:hypothetical protein VPHD148_0026 [Vibrio phage D148]